MTAPTLSLDFMTVSTEVVARSPMERQARAAGARFEERDGWSVAVDYGRPGDPSKVVWADLCHLPKTEVTEQPGGDQGWWLPMTPSRGLVVGARVPGLDVTTAFGAMLVAGPLARETIARFSALDLRTASPGTWKAGSVARTPGGILCTGADRYVLLFGAAYAQYLWTVVADAAGHLGGGPVGADA